MVALFDRSALPRVVSENTLVCSLAIVISIMVLGGAAGGLANFLRAPDGTGDIASRSLSDLLRLIAIGIIAALSLPLFLSLAKSKLISDILNESTNYSDMLILGGFGIVAGFTAGPFLDRLSGQVLQEVKRRAEHNEKKIDQVETQIERLDENSPAAQQTTVPTDEAATPQILQAARRVDLTTVEREVLRGLTTKAYRTRSGLADDAGVSKTRISEILEALIDRGLAEPTLSPNTGGRRFKLTELGRAAVQVEWNG